MNYIDLGYDKNLTRNTQSFTSMTPENVESKFGAGVINPYAVGQIRTSQVASPDWSDFNNLIFVSGGITNRVSIQNGTPADYFSLGDKIELTESSTIKYFYVTNVGASYIDVYAGTEYTYSMGTINLLRRSRVTNPSGHPIVFRKAFTGSEISATGASISGFVNGGGQSFWMNGNHVSYACDAQFFITFSSSPPYVYITLPIQRSSSAYYKYIETNRIQRYAWGASERIVILSHDSALSSGNAVRFYRSDADFATGNAAINYNHSYIIVNQP